MFARLLIGLILLSTSAVILYLKYRTRRTVMKEMIQPSQDVKKSEDLEKILKHIINKYEMIIIFDHNDKIVFCSEFCRRVFRISTTSMKDLKRLMMDYMPYDAAGSGDFFNFDYISYLYTDFGYYIVNAFKEEMYNVIVMSDISICAYEVMLKELVQEINLNIVSLVNEMIFIQNKHRILLNNCIGKINQAIFSKVPIYLSYGYEGYVIAPYNLQDVLSSYKENMDKRVYYKLLNSVKLQKRWIKNSVHNIQSIVYPLLSEFQNVFDSKLSVECVNLNVICKIESLSAVIERIFIICDEQSCEMKIYGNCVIKIIGLKTMDNELENTLIRNGYNFTFIQAEKNELMIILDCKES
jgi:hypothetical protein